MLKNHISRDTLVRKIVNGLEYRVEIKLRRNVALVLFVAAWIGLSTVIISLLGLYLSAAPDPDGGNVIILAVWIFFFSVPLAILLVIVFWNLFGWETFSAGYTEVVLAKKILGLGVTRRFVPAEVKNLRAAGPAGQGARHGAAWYGLGPGKILFECGGRTYSFALALSEVQARVIVKELAGYLLPPPNN